MERVQKEQVSRNTASASHVMQGKSAWLPAQTDMVSRINNSPLMIAQRKQLQKMFGDKVQLQAEEKEPLQGKYAAVQRVEEEEPLQGKFATAQLEGIEEEEPVQGKFSVAQREGLEDEEPLQGQFVSAPTFQLEQQPAGKPNNTGLPDNLKTGIETLSGMSMDSVKVHYNSSQPAQLNALAYAQGNDIHVAPGQERHLPHEAWHVVQQTQGRVQPTMQMKDGVPVNDDPGLEHEADVMGGRALSPLQAMVADSPRQLSQARIIQMMMDMNYENNGDSYTITCTGEKTDFTEGGNAGNNGLTGVESYKARITRGGGGVSKSASVNDVPNDQITYAKGHMMAKSLGGSGNANYIFAQESGRNNSGEWKSFEARAREVVRTAPRDDTDITYTAEFYGDDLRENQPI